MKISSNWIFLSLGFYLIISIFQITAVTDSLILIFNVDNTFFEGVIFIFSIFLTFTPVVGPILGIIGATLVWGWNIFFAIILFFWPYVFLFLGMIGRLSGAISLCHVRGPWALQTCRSIGATGDLRY